MEGNFQMNLGQFLKAKLPYLENIVDSTGEHDKLFDKKLNEFVLTMGQIKTSKTFPSLCRVTMDTAIANLEMVARLNTINYEGELQSQGGDPVSALGKSIAALLRYVISSWSTSNLLHEMSTNRIVMLCTVSFLLLRKVRN